MDFCGAGMHRVGCLMGCRTARIRRLPPSLPPFPSFSLTRSCAKPRLQPGGYFVNLGPLLYRWADAHTYLAGEQLSVELSLEEVKAAAVSIGLRLLREELVPAAFLANQR